jgi:hypothetical protein
VEAHGYRDTWLHGANNNLTAHSSNPTYRIDYVFTHDGYTPTSTPTPPPTADTPPVSKKKEDLIQSSPALTLATTATTTSIATPSYSGGSHWTVSQSYVDVSAGTASDHFPVVVILRSLSSS